MAGRYKVAPREDRTIDGVVFDSKHEATQYLYLKALQRAGTIRNLELQVKFPLWAYDHHGDKVEICAYVADFTFTGCEDGQFTVADAKGHLTDIYRLKRKWFMACYFPLRIVEL